MFPSEGNVSSIAKFELHTKKISTKLPSDLGSRLPHLGSMLLYENQFTGPIPILILTLVDSKPFNFTSMNSVARSHITSGGHKSNTA